jgi:Tol biopolymer transport system component
MRFGDPADILMAKADGSGGPVVVAQGFAPTWSPDGSHFAYVLDCEVHVAEAAGGFIGPDIFSVRGITYTWRADGSILATANDGSSATYDRAGKTIEALPANANLAPRGDLVAIREQVKNEGDGPPFTSRIHLKDAATGATVRTFNDTSSVTFSPDGRYLAFESFVCCEQKLFLLDLEDKDAVPQLVIVARGIPELAWAPDSKRLAFTHRASEPAGNDILTVVEAGSLRQTTIAQDAARPQWFPDGKRVLYASLP